MCGVSKSESLFGLLFHVSNEANVEIFFHFQQFITVRTLLLCFVSFLPLQFIWDIFVSSSNNNNNNNNKTLSPFPLFRPSVRHIFNEGVDLLDEPFELVR